MGAAQTPNSMEADVARLVRAAENLAERWPTQPPPPVPEVAIVARNGEAVVPLLLSLLSDNPDAEGDRKRWKVQQQVSLTLSRIYSEPEHCGRTYCDGDSPERIARVKQGWLQVIASENEIRALPARDLLDRFREEKVFWRQFKIGQALVATNDRLLISELEAWLTHDDRHVRGNVAFVLGRLGDARGFDTIVEMLTDRASRSAGQGVPGNWNMSAQIRADRYYAAHLLGDLKEPRGLELLIPLLNDDEVSHVVPWALGEIGDSRAIEPLLEQTHADDPSRRVLAISALEQLNAREALPRLRELLKDSRGANFGGGTSVAHAAKRAIAVISQRP